MHIYTYQIGHIPPITEATNQEINTLEQLTSDLIVNCAGNFHASDLIVNCAGNFHALEKLYQMLDDAKDTCYLNLCQIEIVANEK